MSIFSKLINDASETARVNQHGPGLNPLSPAISGSLSIPIENIADLVSKKLISESIKESEKRSQRLELS